MDRFTVVRPDGRELHVTIDPKKGCAWLLERYTDPSTEIVTFGKKQTIATITRWYNASGNDSDTERTKA